MQANEESKMTEKLEKSEAEWRESLTPEQFWVTRQAGTEPAFTGAYWNEKSAGSYDCVCCGQALFRSDEKYDSGSGWPSFWQPVDENNVEVRRDATHGMIRLEVMCSRCGAHLGHVFEDGPKPTGLRYCINSVSLDLKSKSEKEPSE